MGLVSCVHTAGAWFCIRKHLSRTLYGAVLGSGCVMVIIHLETAVFFGQYSECQKKHSEYSYDRSTYGESV